MSIVPSSAVSVELVLPTSVLMLTSTDRARGRFTARRTGRAREVTGMAPWTAWPCPDRARETPLRKQRHVCRQQLVAVIGDQDVVLDADAAEAEHGLGALPVDGITVSLAQLGVVQELRHEVDPGLDREDVAGHERQVDAQAREFVLRRLAPTQNLARVANSEADHVADAVREEQRLGAALDQALRFAAQQPQLDQALGDDQRSRAVHVAPLGAGG